MQLKLTTDKIQLFAYFTFIALFGSLLLSLPIAYKPQYDVRYIDALFTSVSAVCVTGLSTLDMSVYSDTGIAFILLLIEFGGLGLISFISLYLLAPRRKVSLVNRAIIREFFIEDVEYEPKKILSTIVIFTLATEALAALALYVPLHSQGEDKALLVSVFHSVSAFCNAGFSTYTDSLGGYSDKPWFLGIIAFLVIVGGIGFIVLADISAWVSRKRKRISHHSLIVVGFTLFLILFGSVVFYIMEAHNAFSSFSDRDKVLNALFQSITPRTAGFSVIDQKSLSSTSRLVTLLLMFIGGSPGSIAGGVKTTTFLVVLLYALRGNAKGRGMNLLGRNIGTDAIEKAFSIIAKSLLIIMVSITGLSITERVSIDLGLFSLFDVIFESVSAFATVGLSLGITGSLTTPGKILIIATMFIGRTGIVAMALGFVKNERERYFDYPSASIMIG